jgi:D-sedoheptulose 7-phosphate isomerase
MINEQENLIDFLNNYFVEHEKCYFELYRNETFRNVRDKMRTCWESGKTIHLAGNGGSAAMVSHFSTDWTKGLHLTSGKIYKTRVLTDNIPLLTAAANDFSWETALSSILEMNFDQEDILLIVSSSGNSSNLVNLAKKAKEIGITTISLSGFAASNLTKVTDLSLTTSCTDIQQIEDAHSIFGHLIYKIFSKI